MHSITVLVVVTLFPVSIYVVSILVSRDPVYVSYMPVDVMCVCVRVQIKKPVQRYVGLRVLYSGSCEYPPKGPSEDCVTEAINHQSLIVKVYRADALSQVAVCHL